MHAKGECNLYYPSTISVERIEGARITVITTDTRNNIMRDAFRVYFPPAVKAGEEQHLPPQMNFNSIQDAPEDGK